MRAIVGLIAVVVVAVGAAFLAMRNSATVTVDLLLVSMANVPLWGVLLGSFLIGGLLVGSILSWPYFRLRLRLRTQSRQITRLEQEVHGLRTLPLPDEVSGAGEG